jgi:hypothetical protein
MIGRELQNIEAFINESAIDLMLKQANKQIVLVATLKYKAFLFLNFLSRICQTFLNGTTPKLAFIGLL